MTGGSLLSQDCCFPEAALLATMMPEDDVQKEKESVDHLIFKIIFIMLMPVKPVTAKDRLAVKPAIAKDRLAVQPVIVKDRLAVKPVIAKYRSAVKPATARQTCC